MAVPDVKPTEVVADTPAEVVEKNMEPTKTLTQAEVDAIVKDRLQRERAKYADYNDLKAAAGKYAEIEESKKSELEKAQAKIKEWQTKYEQTQTAIMQTTKRAAVTVESMRLGLDPKLTGKLVDYGLLEVDDKGEVSNAKDVLEAMLKEYPQLTATAKPPQPGMLDASAGGSGKTQTPKMNDAQVREWGQKFNLSFDVAKEQLTRQGRI